MRWMVAAWVGAALLATMVLGGIGATAGPLPEWGHIAGHLVLCGGLAALICAATSGSPARRGLVALGGAMLFGVGIELVQLRYGPPTPDALFDLAIDAVGASLGVAAWGRSRPERSVAVGHLLSAVLHPLWVAPLGLAAEIYAGERAFGPAARWTLLGAVCLGPAIGWWLAGVTRQWWTDADVSRRSDRRTLFVVGCAGMAVFELLAMSGPGPIPALALGILVGSVLGLGITAAGLKVSGHVAIPAMLGLVIAEASVRGPLPLLGVAVLLSWARVAAGRHRPVEVLAGWGLAIVSAGIVGMA